MSKKIKSVTFKQVIYSSPDAAIEEKEDSFKITHNILGKDTWIEIGKGLVKNIEYEPEPEPEKPGQLFYPNGAVVRPLEENQRYWYINSSNGISSYIWNEDETDFGILESQNAFLTEEAAEKAKQVKDNHNWILAKVMEINAENNWVADWSDDDQKKYYVDWEHGDGKRDWGCTYQCQKQLTNMCQEAKDWLMSDEVSDTDFKAFCLIYE